MSAKTLEELARKLEVSRRTISRVIKGDSNVAEETRKRVLGHLERESYFPNIHAASLASRKVSVVGLVFPRDTFVNTDFFAIDTIKGIARATNENNYQLMMFTQNQFDVFQCLKLYKSKLVGGLILVSVSKEEAKGLPELKKGGVPTTLIFAYSKEIDSFGCDNVKGGYMATKRLIDTGRKRIAFIHGHESWFDAAARFTGYKNALSEAGMEFDPAYVEVGYFRYADAEVAMKKLLDLGNPPDAVFAANDRMAIGAIKAIRDSGRRVPDDIAVIGFDNIPLCELLDPPITTIEQPIADIAYESAVSLLNLIESPGRKTHIKYFEPKLIIRKSA